jgi:hypothetical protein
LELQLKRVSTLGLAAILAVMLGAASAPPSLGAADPALASKAYIGQFCGPIALSDSSTGSLMQQLGQWDMKAGTEADAYAARPQDADAPGQLFRFPDKDAPTVFVDRRRGVCTLVYPSQRTPPAIVGELATEKLPVNTGAPPVGWRRVKKIGFGPPGPIRYFLKVGEGQSFGLCTAIFEDLRLKDGSPATMVRVSACRLAPDEMIADG